MKLLIVTQKVDKNDPILGFFHRWIEEFSKYSEEVVVICLYEGVHDLPKNVKVLSLGKERGLSKVAHIGNFYRFIWRERKNYDKVFVHMNPEYMALSGWLWRSWSKRTALWYVHRQTNLKLWLAEKLANVIFTSAPESFQLKSRKVQYVGHGIDIELFRFSKKDFNAPSILHVGRITRIKNIDVIIKAVKSYPLSLVGEPMTADDRKYEDELKQLASDLGAEVRWVGAVQNSQMPAVYGGHSLSINAAPDGGMDKAVLESLSAGCPAFTSNSAFDNMLGEYAPIFRFEFGNAEDLRDKIINFLREGQKEEIAERLSKRVRSEYDVTVLINKISNLLDE